MWQQLYDALPRRQSGGRAEREYLGMLALAIEHGLTEVSQFGVHLLFFGDFLERFTERLLEGQRGVSHDLLSCFESAS
jgi:hypothetical protein